jgi:hypothetical protein
LAHGEDDLRVVPERLEGLHFHYHVFTVLTSSWLAREPTQQLPGCGR